MGLLYADLEVIVQRLPAGGHADVVLLDGDRPGEGRFTRYADPNR